MAYPVHTPGIPTAGKLPAYDAKSGTKAIAKFSNFFSFHSSPKAKDQARDLEEATFLPKRQRIADARTNPPSPPQQSAPRMPANGTDTKRSNQNTSSTSSSFFVLQKTASVPRSLHAHSTLQRLDASVAALSQSVAMLVEAVAAQKQSLAELSKSVVSQSDHDRMQAESVIAAEMASPGSPGGLARYKKFPWFLTAGLFEKLCDAIIPPQKFVPIGQANSWAEIVSFKERFTLLETVCKFGPQLLDAHRLSALAQRIWESNPDDNEQAAASENARMVLSLFEINKDSVTQEMVLQERARIRKLPEPEEWGSYPPEMNLFSEFPRYYSLGLQVQLVREALYEIDNVLHHVRDIAEVAEARRPSHLGIGDMLLLAEVRTGPPREVIEADRVQYWGVEFIERIISDDTTDDRHKLDMVGEVARLYFEEPVALPAPARLTRHSSGPPPAAAEFVR